MLDGKLIMKKRRGRRKVLNKAAKIVVKKARYKIGDSARKLSNSYQAKSRRGRHDGKKPSA